MENNYLTPPEWKEIAISKIYVDHTYQQALDENWVEYLFNNWNPIAAGSLLLSHHESDGSYATPDGQHRLVVMRKKGIRTWPCEVHYGLTLQQEAELFLSRNDRKVVAPISKFIAQVQAKYPTALEIKEILRKNGSQIGFRSTSSKSAYYECVTSVREAYRKGVLADVIFLIETCWGIHEHRARTKLIVDGTTLFMLTFGGHKNFSLDKALDKFSNPENHSRKMNLIALVRKVKNDASALGTSQTYEFAKQLREIYNKGGRSNVLPELRR
jgi:hypothetical protein